MRQEGFPVDGCTTANIDAPASNVYAAGLDIDGAAGNLDTCVAGRISQLGRVC
jgi:hypothetical protein